MKKRIALIAVIVSVVLCALLVLIPIARKKSFVDKLTNEGGYSTVFVSQFDITNFSEEDFLHYIGEKAFVNQATTLNNVAKKCSWTLENSDTGRVFIGLDPFEIDYEKALGSKTGRLINSAFFNLLEENPDVRFDVLLFYPNLYCKNKNKETLIDALDSYEILINTLDLYDNVYISFPGYEEWMLANPLTVTEGVTHADVATETVAACFADGRYYIDESSQWDAYENIVRVDEKYKNTNYPDWSDKTIVYFGDSIIGYYTGVNSIPQSVYALTGAKGINVGKSGTTATNDFAQAVKDYFAENTIDADNTVFVINYGINDYFGDVSPTGENEGTYEYGLKQGIAAIREQSDGPIVIASPTYIDYAENDREKYECYVAASEKTAKEEGCIFLDNYNNIGIGPENTKLFLTDGVHLNGNGRIMYANALILRLEEELK